MRWCVKSFNIKFFSLCKKRRALRFTLWLYCISELYWLKNEQHFWLYFYPNTCYLFTIVIITGKINMAWKQYMIVGSLFSSLTKLSRQTYLSIAKQYYWVSAIAIWITLLWFWSKSIHFWNKWYNRRESGYVSISSPYFFFASPPYIP